MDASQGRITVAVAMISVLGVIATGVLTNWDKIFDSGPAPQASANAAPATSPAVARDPGAAEPAEARAQSASAPVPNIAGNWHDVLGQTFQIRQEGPVLTLQRNINGVLVFGADGGLEGHRIRYRFRTLIGDATVDGGCAGTVRSENLIEGDCIFDNGPTVPFRLTR